MSPPSGADEPPSEDSASATTAVPQFVSWPRFDRELKRLERKYPNVAADLRKAIESPTTRMDPVPSYAHRLWKARIPSTDMKRGGRGGFRLYLWVEKNAPPAPPITAYPVTMYPKNEREDLTVDEMRALLNRLFEWAPQLDRRK